MVTWAASQIRSQERDLIGSAPLRTQGSIAGLGEVEIFHATPRSDEEIVLRTTGDDIAAEALEVVTPAPAASQPVSFASGRAKLAVSGHTRLPTEHVVGSVRWVDAGSLGKPIDHAGASWMLWGPDVEWRRTAYDVEAGAAAARRSTPAASSGLGAASVEAVAEELIASLHPGGRQEALGVLVPLAAATYGRWAARSRLGVLDAP